LEGGSFVAVKLSGIIDWPRNGTNESFATAAETTIESLKCENSKQMMFEVKERAAKYEQ
jgi:hypothetical protein